MIAGFSTVCVVMGAAIAYMAKRYPRQREAIETVGGILLIGGFGMLGYALESSCGHPQKMFDARYFPSTMPLQL